MDVHLDTASGMSMPPPITVILATRDRPVLFEQALQSVLDQSYAALEIVVVNDGSDPVHLPAYEAVWARAEQRLGTRFRVSHLLRRAKGHGQSYALNHGCSLAQSAHVTFLDDDDYWTDNTHLRRVGAAIDRFATEGRQLDLYMANQEAWRVGGERVGVLWLGDMGDRLRARGRQAEPSGQFIVGVDELMSSSGFCHLNCLTVRRALYEAVGGMDEGIRWECDRDLFLKLIDAEGVMLLDPRVVSYHRVPDPAKATNMTTTLGMLDKRLLQAQVLDKALARARHPTIRRHAQVHRAYALERITHEYIARQDWTVARSYAGQALGTGFSPGRFLVWLRCMWHQMLTSG